MRQTWRGYGRFTRLAWRASPALTVLTVLMLVLNAAAPLGAAVAIGAVVSRVPSASAMPWAIAVGAFFLLQWLAIGLYQAAAAALAERVNALLQRDLMAAVMRPVGIGHLEDPASLNLINVGQETFRSGWSRPGRLARTLSGVLNGRLMLIGACVIVAKSQPVWGIALLLAGLWAAYEDKVASRIEANHHHSGTEISRRTEYYYDLGVTPPAAKEIRIFGLGPYLLDRYLASWNRSMDEVLAPTSRRPFVAAIALGAVVLGALGSVAGSAGGSLAAGAAMAVVQALMVSLAGARITSWSSLQTELALATLRRYDDAVASLASTPSSGGAVVGAPQREIRFERVSFGYPGGTGDAVHELDLVVPAGRSLAIVGANGAGKSTLVKLLSRMYEPSSGRISVDDVDLASADVEAWRSQLAAVFQNSTRFALTAQANVSFGRVSTANLDAAAKAAGIDDVIAALPDGWNTPLSAEYDGGVDLSGGEWQKIGLARALYAVSNGASVLILDEPAAHLDARAEARLYERFLELTSGVTTIVISHRFSTVRQASSIVVLDQGRVVEQGTHEELLALDGAYAEMFRLQASRFSEAS
ncbi:ABC transporter ATP-binding protein [Tenggerimyces flavus]|uniref:ABC transporter ATP-binding protein n=1 Tax=Tenggerimyces flavus TaxID=1708749 RepID=A0ABV7Y6D6_9ACTN|nr:ABC transporter ATP-binding protein [Tenggerimyces flavus]MBM7785105.1 ATP-binding cassette subfamily B protein [Tenggerimyces flavus]